MVEPLGVARPAKLAIRRACDPLTMTRGVDTTGVATIVVDVVVGVVVVVEVEVDPLMEHSDSTVGVMPLTGKPGQPVLPAV